jgi:hypothetical protein
VRIRWCCAHLTVHICRVNFHGVLSVAAATSFAFISPTAHFPKPFFLPASLSNLHHLQTDAFFMDPYKTSYSNTFSLHLNTNFYTTESDRFRVVYSSHNCLCPNPSVHSSMALQPLLGPGLPLKTPPFFSFFCSSPPSSYSYDPFCVLPDDVLPSRSCFSHWSCITKFPRCQHIQKKLKLGEAEQLYQNFILNVFLILCYKFADIFWGANWVLVLFMSPRSTSFVNLVVGGKK